MDSKRLEVNSPEWWDSVVPKYLERGDLRDRREEYMEVASRILYGPVLEIGPAFGMFSRYLRPATQYLGLEISPDLTAEARKRNPNKTFVCGNVLNLGEHQWGKAFEHACAFQILEHLTWPDFYTAIQRIEAVTRDSLFFSVPRGIPTKADATAEGHLIGWKDEAAMERTLNSYGTVTWLNSDDNHLLGELHFEGEQS